MKLHSTLIRAKQAITSAIATLERNPQTKLHLQQLKTASNELDRCLKDHEDWVPAGPGPDEPGPRGAEGTASEPLTMPEGVTAAGEGEDSPPPGTEAAAAASEQFAEHHQKAVATAFDKVEENLAADIAAASATLTDEEIDAALSGRNVKTRPDTPETQAEDAAADAEAAQDAADDAEEDKLEAELAHETADTEQGDPPVKKKKAAPKKDKFIVSDPKTGKKAAVKKK